MAETRYGQDHIESETAASEHRNDDQVKSTYVTFKDGNIDTIDREALKSLIFKVLRFYGISEEKIRMDVEDILGKLMLELLPKIKNKEKFTNLDGLIYTIIRHSIIDQLRKNKNWEARDPGEVATLIDAGVIPSPWSMHEYRRSLEDVLADKEIYDYVFGSLRERETSDGQLNIDGLRFGQVSHLKKLCIVRAKLEGKTTQEIVEEIKSKFPKSRKLNLDSEYVNTLYKRAQKKLFADINRKFGREMVRG